MANNVTIPATGSGDATPKVSTDQVSGDSSQVQNVQQVTVSGGVMTRGVPLPSGASTETTLAAANTAIGTTADAASSTTGTVIAHLRKIRDLLAGTLTVGASSWPLPSGASTESTLASVNTKLGNALPLPTGASTETTLAAVNTKLGSALPLPTGAATAAKQPALGTAGTPASDVRKSVV